MDYEVKTYYVAFFSNDIDCYKKYSINLGLDNAKGLLKSLRKKVPIREWVILAVLDI